MGRGKHANWSHKKKREMYNTRRKQEGYPKGGYNKPPNRPYMGEKRSNKQ